MKRNITIRCSSSVTCTFLLLVTCLPASFSASDTHISSRGKSLLKLEQAKSAQYLQRMQELRMQQKRDFARSRELLNQEGVPFDPDELLEANWPEKLAPKLAQMPAMQTDQEVRSDHISGVYIAHRLSLPEKMKADGDLVILARHLVYRGEDVEIIAPGHDVSVFIVESEEKIPSYQTA